MKTEYSTKQGKAILEYLEHLDGTHTTAKDILQYLISQDIRIGLTTVYRHLDKLVDLGDVKKYTLDETSASCYQYCPEHLEEPAHFHLKCEECGKLIHLQCHQLNGIAQHIMDDHGFSINHTKTVFYGVCADCAQ